MPPAPSNSPEAARRLFRSGRPIPGTHAEAYLRARGITGPVDWMALRFHPRVWYRETNKASLEAWPALLAAVTDSGGRITGIQRTWLDRHRPDKAPIANPRRALGHLLSNGVRFGAAADVMDAGEGIETMLALKSVLPMLPMIAALSANHLGAFDLPLPSSASMSRATTMRPVSRRRSGSMNAGKLRGSTCAISRLCTAISTPISPSRRLGAARTPHSSARSGRSRAFRSRRGFTAVGVNRCPALRRNKERRLPA